MTDLAQIVVRSGTCAFVAARFASRLSRQPGSDERATMRRIFQDEFVSLLPTLTASTASGLAGRLVSVLTTRLGVGLDS